jgi:hypothetical protein
VLHSQVLDFVPFPLDMEKTKPNIVNFVQNQLMESGFQEEELQNAVFVTDEGSTMNGFGIL